MLIMVEGFDKYGPSNSWGTQALIATGDWTTVTGVWNIAAGLSATGGALIQQSGPASLSRTLPANYTRLIGGFRFQSSLQQQINFMAFRDGATTQCLICVETSGIVTFRNAGIGGTIIAQGAVLATNSIHYIEFDITFGNAASYQIWLDGASLFSGTGDTTATSNNFANGLLLTSPAGVCDARWDDMYLFDTTGSTNNAVLLTNPRVETTFPTSDNTTQFAFGSAVLGPTIPRLQSAVANPVANFLSLRAFTPVVNCTIASITIIPQTTYGVAQIRGVIYADSAGAAGALLSSGSLITGITASVPRTLPLLTPQALTAGTQYWIGLHTDTSIAIWLYDASATGYRGAASFASGAPSTAPAMSSGQGTWHMYGNLTSVATGNNWYETSQQPPPGVLSYVFDATVMHEDLYNFGPLSSTPAAIYAVVVKAYCAKSDAGARTISIRTKSGAVDDPGSAPGQALGTSFQWLNSVFPYDPNTAAAWLPAALNAAASGFRIDS